MSKLKKVAKFIFKIFLVLFSLATVIWIIINFPIWKENSYAQLGTTFSARYARDIGVDWKANYLAMLDDLHIKKIRLPVYWDQVEPKEGEYDFSELDWQLQEAKKRNAEIILAVGQKVPRWPECFIPEYAKASDDKRKSELLKFVGKVVEHYRTDPTVKYWQVENEPFLKFGICPEINPDLLDSEIAVVRSADPSRKIIITDSGELSLWVQAGKRADIFGTTMYRKIYSPRFGYYNYPIGPSFFILKSWLNKLITGQSNSIVIELQAEPWIAGWTISSPLDTQFASMNPEILRSNVTFARKVGFPEVYLWGVEWWYWLKTTQNHPELWDTARELYQNQN